MASDRLWDTFEDNASIVQANNDAQISGGSVTEQAEYLQNQAIKKGSRDNITVIIVDFFLHDS